MGMKESSKKATAKRATKAPSKRGASKKAGKAVHKEADERSATGKAGKAPPKKGAGKATAKRKSSKAPAKKAAKKRDPERAPRAARPTVRAKKAALEAAPEPVTVAKPAPPPAEAVSQAQRGDVSAAAKVRAPSSRTTSYLDAVPKDHGELVSALFQVVRGAAKDLRTLVSQAIAMSQHKNDRSDR